MNWRINLLLINFPIIYIFAPNLIAMSAVIFFFSPRIPKPRSKFKYPHIIFTREDFYKIFFAFWYVYLLVLFRFMFIFL